MQAPRHKLFTFGHLHTGFVNVRVSLSLCPCLSVPFPVGILCSAISISWYLLFFCCNQTHRFISVALRHHLNQFPSTLPSWRAAVRVGTSRLRTHLYAHTGGAHAHTLSFIHPHSRYSTQPGTYKTHTGSHTLRAVIHHITVL